MGPDSQILGAVPKGGRGVWVSSSAVWNAAKRTAFPVDRLEITPGAGAGEMRPLNSQQKF